MASTKLRELVATAETKIGRDGVTEEVAYAFRQYGEYALDKEQDIEFGLAQLKRAKLLIRQIIRERTNGSVWDLDKYCCETGASYKVLDEYYRCLKAEAYWLFDSYLIYLEKNRPWPEKFYLPKKKQFIKHDLIQSLQDLEENKLRFLSISLPPGTGKAQPLYSKVLTPKGFVEMGSIKVGDKVIAANGKVSEVLGVYPQGLKPIYEITFDDGSKCRCSDEHLWRVQTRDDRNRGKYRTIMLKDMLHNVRVENDNRKNYSIDCVGKIDYGHKNFIVHPYIMGVLLGDGEIKNTPKITSIDNEVIEKVNEFLPSGYFLKLHDRCTYSVHGHEGNNAKAGSIISKELKRYELFGKGSLDKYIPDEYKKADYEQRLWLLRGLMDTDGTSDKKGACSFTSISKRLADDVVEIVNSLGGKARISVKKCGYKKDGKYIKCNDAYNVSISLPNNKDMFCLTRKKERCRENKKVLRYIDKIEYVGEDYCQCIYISDESHLYITDDYIVTHNTTLEKFFLSWVIGRHPQAYSLFFSHSNEITDMFYRGVLDITTNDTVYTFSEIFPNCKLQATNAKGQTINFGQYKPFASLQCTSVGSKNAGKVRCGGGGYLLCDDLIGGIEEALNKALLDKVFRIYGVDAKQRKQNESVKELMIATRWSLYDPIGRLKNIYAGDPECRFIAVPDIDEATGESNFDYEFNGMSVDFFKDQALTMDDISYRCLFKNEPIEREGLLYHDDDLRRYLDLPIQEPDAILGICDVKNKGSDFMFLPCVYQYGEDYYCVDCICDDGSDYGLQYQRLANLILENNMQQCEFESNTGGDRVAYEVDKIVKEFGGRCNITTKATETNKETRIIVNSDWVKRHIIFRDKSLYMPKSDYGVMMSWLLAYSIVGKNPHDDVPDGFANFALYVTRKKATSSVEAVFNPFRGDYY